MIFVFKYDTPSAIKKKKDFMLLKEFMYKIYPPDLIQKKIDEIEVDVDGGDNSDIPLG